jgi:hypothetical protein
MAMKDVGWVTYPPVANQQTLGASVQTFIIDSVGEYVAIVFAAPRSGNIRKIHFRTATVTTVGSGLEVRMETVDTSTGYPTGTLWGANNNVTVAAITANTWHAATLTADAVVSVGDILAVKVGALASFNGNLVTPEQTSFSLTEVPYQVVSQATTSKGTRAGGMAIEWSDGEIYPIPGMAMFFAAQVSFTSASTPDEVGAKLTPPCSGTAWGIYFTADLDNNPDIVVYEGDSTVLQTFSITSGWRRTGGMGLIYLPFTTPKTIKAGQVYRIALKPGASAALRAEWTFPTDGAIRSMTGTNGASYKCSRTDAGAWDDTATSVYIPAGFVFSALDDGLGAGRAGYALGV